MHLLLDECTPRALGRLLSPHEVTHASEPGWKGLENGELLEGMRVKGLAGLVTTDRNLSFQQSLPQSEVFVVLLVATSNRIEHLAPLAPDLLRVLKLAESGRLYRVGA